MVIKIIINSIRNQMYICMVLMVSWVLESMVKYQKMIKVTLIQMLKEINIKRTTKNQILIMDQIVLREENIN